MVVMQALEINLDLDFRLTDYHYLLTRAKLILIN